MKVYKRPLEWRMKISKAHKGMKKPWSAIDKTGREDRGWKGDNITYVTLHNWVRLKLGTPDSREYRRDLNDWIRLCQPCHSKYDNSLQKAWITRRARYI